MVVKNVNVYSTVARFAGELAVHHIIEALFIHFSTKRKLVCLRLFASPSHAHRLAPLTLSMLRRQPHLCPFPSLEFWYICGQDKSVQLKLFFEKGIPATPFRVSVLSVVVVLRLYNTNQQCLSSLWF